MRELFRLLGETLDRKEDAVLVTVVASSGSTPRGAGARMLITKEGRLRGTIGGGAVEYKSEERARELLEKKNSHMEQFLLRKNQVQDLGMVCGGDVNVYFHYISHENEQVKALVRDIENLYKTREVCWLIHDISEDAHGGMALYGQKTGLKGMDVPKEVLHSLGAKPARLEAAGHQYYCEKLVQSGIVYIFGGGHVAQALVPILASVDFRCMVLEDREDFCKPELFPGAIGTMLIDNNKVNEYIDIQEEDYLCIMTRGHKDDMMIQSQVLATPAHYIGVIGSRRKVAAVNEQLRERGWTDKDFKRITTPIGLDIKGETPAEIAVSITAQLIENRASRMVE